MEKAKSHWGELKGIGCKIKKHYKGVERHWNQVKRHPLKKITKHKYNSVLFGILLANSHLKASKLS